MKDVILDFMKMEYLPQAFNAIKPVVGGEYGISGNLYALHQLDDDRVVFTTKSGRPLPDFGGPHKEVKYIWYGKCTYIIAHDPIGINVYTKDSKKHFGSNHYNYMHAYSKGGIEYLCAREKSSDDFPPFTVKSFYYTHSGKRFEDKIDVLFTAGFETFLTQHCIDNILSSLNPLRSFVNGRDEDKLADTYCALYKSLDKIVRRKGSPKEREIMIEELLSVIHDKIEHDPEYFMEMVWAA